MTAVSLHQGEIIPELLPEVLSVSDRSAVITMAAFVDDELKERIKSRLLPHGKKSDDPLFDGPNAALGTFSARIHMARRLKVICNQEARLLEQLKNIRNRYAHRPVIDTKLQQKTDAFARFLLEHLKADTPAGGYDDTFREILAKVTDVTQIEVQVEIDNLVGLTGAPFRDFAYLNGWTSELASRGKLLFRILLLFTYGEFLTERFPLLLKLEVSLEANYTSDKSGDMTVDYFGIRFWELL
jgi:hypothetical protein